MTEALAVTDWGGPDPELLERIHMAMQAPSWGDLSFEESDAIRERLIAGRTFDALDGADQQFIVRCEGEVRAGLSKTWQRYSEPDWAAEDRAVEAADRQGKSYDFDDLPGVDDDGWVGV